MSEAHDPSRSGGGKQQDEGKAPREEALDRREARARLKIFLGMSAGVGKTYAMLREASRLKERGTDLVVGWLEAHGRSETDALAEGLERVRPQVVTYKGLRILEMDLPAILARKPALALVDELAHTNTPGMRHPKRYEDILELLDAGISVFTTVNIQHLESMADSVELVTLAPVRERVPDSVFDRADEVQLIDLPPEELLERLSEGKVYTGPASREAVANFFTKGNLAVLREIALRQASQLASHQLLDIMRSDTGLPSAGASQRVLVAVGPSPYGENLLRWARRLAYALRAEWDCVTVETGDELSEGEKAALSNNLELARSLGASVSSVPDTNVAAGILGFARSSNSSFIVVGKSGISRARRILGVPSISERIIMESGNLPVFAVQEKPVREPLRRRARRRIEASTPAQYLTASLAIAATTLLNLAIAGLVGYWGAAIPYLAAISILSLLLGRRAVFLAALLSALAWDFLFIPPRFTFLIRSPADMLMLGLYFLLALTSGWFTGRLRANERMLVSRERHLSALSALASDLAGASSRGAILAAGSAALERFFEAEAVILLRGAEGELGAEPEGGWRPLDATTLSAARYSFTSGKPAGRSTDTLPLVEWRFVPMRAPNEILGVIGLRLGEGRAWTEELESFLATMARTVSIAVERELLSEDKALNTFARESERLGKILLDSVSHELRTPLTIIQGSASALADEATSSDPRSRRLLLSEITEGAARLDAIVGNLLSINRLESGSLALRITEIDQEELVSSALAESARELRDHEIVVRGNDKPGILACDGALMVQVLVNLIRNAASYGGRGGPIILRFGKTRDGWHSFAVEDRGPGLPEADLGRVFEKFYRSANAVPGGCGLGLAICKGIVEAHGGSIEARNLPEGGLSVGFTIPAGQASFPRDPDEDRGDRPISTV